MNKAVSPEQLQLAPQSLEEALKATAPHIDFEGAAFKESMVKIDMIAAEMADEDRKAAAERQRRSREKRKRDSERDDSERHKSSQTVTRDGEFVLCEPQDCIFIKKNELGDAVLTQRCWPDEDQLILITKDNLAPFLDRLCDFMGIPTLGG